MARFRTSLLLAAFASVSVSLTALAQAYQQRPPTVVHSRSPFTAETEPDPQTMQQIANIVRDRPPEAEAAARAFLYNIINHGSGEGPLIVRDGIVVGNAGPPTYPLLDQLKAADPDEYWREVAMLTMQFETFRRVASSDTLRGRAMAAMFATEFQARSIQRAWRSATDAQKITMRSQLETLMSHHFDMENVLRELEIRDIARRLDDARAESEHRRQNKDQLVRWSVEDIIHAAERPE